MRRWRVVLALAGTTMLVPFLGFTGYTVGRARLSPRPGAEVVVVLGCRLRHDRVAPMLARRLNRALEVMGEEHRRGRTPLLVASGGQSGRETVAEAEAMADYLVAQGIPDDRILRENRSRNTEENLRFTVRELRGRGIDPERARITVVTSDFHVLRTAGLVRRLGLRAQVTGARTSRLLTRKSFLREFVAVLVKLGRTG
ncbi:YdcF family protein [Nocardia sp. NPDC101769]|uniref:YdcF family protein n=1 Tax=Nocardia sp. NPDC101769 TaxID=3364333 RepID=UPI0037F76A31